LTLAAWTVPATLGTFTFVATAGTEAVAQAHLDVEGSRDNIQIVQYVHSVPRDHTIWTLLHDLDGSRLRPTRLRAWSGTTGWRFESTSAHRSEGPLTVIAPRRCAAPDTA
jgi:hypothetical protein